MINAVLLVLSRSYVRLVCILLFLRDKIIVNETLYIDHKTENLKHKYSRILTAADSKKRKTSALRVRLHRRLFVCHRAGLKLLIKTAFLKCHEIIIILRSLEAASTRRIIASCINLHLKFENIICRPPAPTASSMFFNWSD